MRSISRFLCLCAFAMSSHAASVTYWVSGTATSTAGSFAPVNASVSFETLTDMVRVTIMNNIVGASKDIQAVAAVNFRLSTGQTSGSIASQSGLVRNIASDGTWTAGSPANFSDASYNGHWSLVAGAGVTSGLSNSLDLSTLNGGNPSLTIFGRSTGASANCCYNAYGAPNKAVTKHNPYLATDGQAVIFNLLVPGVTIGTTILPGSSQVRFFFGTDRSAFLDGTDSPEPGTFVLIGLGLAVAAYARSGQVRRRRSDQYKS